MKITHLIVLFLALVLSGCDTSTSDNVNNSGGTTSGNISSINSGHSQDVHNLPDGLGDTPPFPNDLKDI